MDSGQGRRRFWRAVAAGFLVGAGVIAVVAATRGDDNKASDIRLKQVTLRPRPANASPPAHRKGCTDIWTGRAENGRWNVAANWSARRVPGPADHACLGRGTVVTLVGAKARVGSVSDEGTLYAIPGGELTLLDLSTPSKLQALVLAGGTLGGDASVIIHELNWQENGAMVDGGETVIPRGARAVFLAGNGGSGLLGAKRRLTLRGQFALVSGALYTDASSKIHTSRTSVIDIDTTSDTGEPQGLLKREDGQPGATIRNGRRTLLGTAGRHPHPGPEAR
jgi:hypothetical protein